jgi:hypothetical protein
MNHGTTFFAPFSVAIAIEGLAAGLDPPTLGCAWHDWQLLELKRGPSPLFWPPVTDSISTNLSIATYSRRAHGTTARIGPYS